MNIKRAKQEIKNTVAAYLAKGPDGAYAIPAVRQRPILLMGPPGIGKTQIMEQIARECGIGLVAYTITHHTRQSAVGLPFIRQKNYDGQDVSVTEYTMSEIISSVYDRMEKTGRREGILFIDEINCVSETLAPTMLQFLQCKTFGNQAVPAGWLIVAAGNPPEYNRSVRDFDIVTLDRVRRMDLEADLTVWKEYARAQHLHPAILSYLELRPQNFYKIIPDVDGAQFVTARGWEDLSNLLDTYAALDLPVDEEVVGQYLQHKQIAQDFAAYLDLYKKYRDDYGVEELLAGRVRPGVFDRVFHAAFDERLSLVSLLLSGLNTRFAAARDTDTVTDCCYGVLKDFRKALEEDRYTPAVTYRTLCRAFSAQLEADKACAALDRRTLACRAQAAARLNSWQEALDGTPEDPFAAVRARFNAQVNAREQSIGAASEALEYAFDFMEKAFDKGQEMVVFVTELTLGPDSGPFIQENGCERYFSYNEELLLGQKKSRLAQELDRELATEDIRAGEHSAEF